MADSATGAWGSDGPNDAAPRPNLFRLALARLGRRRRRLTLIRQTTATDCGAACLAMVMSFHGRHETLDSVRTVVGGGRDGATAAGLVEAARRFRLSLRGVQVDALHDLRHLPTPSILHWRFRHFVVLEKVTPRGVWILDPAAGRRFVERRELDRCFTGVALTASPGIDFAAAAQDVADGALGSSVDDLGPRQGVHPTARDRFLQLLRQEAPLWWKILGTSVALQLLALALPWVTGAVVDRVLPRGDDRLWAILAAGAGLVVLFHCGYSLIRSHLLLQLRTRLDVRLTLDFLEHLFDLPYDFFQQRSAGDLMMRLNSNGAVREIVTSGALSTLLDGSLVVLYLGLLLALHPPMALLVLALGALRLIVFVVTRRRLRDLAVAGLQTQADSRSFQVQMLSGIETLKVLGAERRAVEHWSHLFVGELNVSLDRGRFQAVVDSVMAGLGMGSPLVILLFGARAVLSGELSLGVMLAISALAAGFLGPLSGLVSTFFQFELLRSYWQRIEDVLQSPREQPEQGTRPRQTLSGAISLEKVSFAYSSAGQDVVQDISVDIPAGSFVALVGPSGAGKSTLAHLLLGLYRPTAGRIAFDGHDLARLDLRWMRQQLGIVTQQPFVFGGSIRSNIALGAPDLSLRRIQEAAEAAQLHREIEALPMGYETLLSDAGANLSGGQRQRLALARALARRPSILLLDEATSSLDTLTERRIHRRLAELNSTRIVIAHRLSTIRDADVIIVLDQGRIVERGPHQELLGAGGHYGRLVAAQAGKPA